MNAVNEAFLSGQQSGLLRLITAGSVDDGKSTLIGRLLYDSKGVYADQLDAIARSRHKRVAGDGFDFALLTDGLEAEREQGITIDVAYRYFSTPARKFIVADAPGHEQYTRNMVTGASTADAIIILIDASRVVGGELLVQTKRHSMIARLLGIRHVVVAVNKMDLLAWDQAVFERIRDAYTELARRLDIAPLHILPLSALNGDNVVTRSANTPWYQGPPLLELLESLEPVTDGRDLPLRLPIQWVLRHGGSQLDHFRGYAGRLASGILKSGDAITIQPSGISATIHKILVSEREVEEARAGDSIVVVLDRDVDASRGDVFVHEHSPVALTRELEAELCWLDTQALNPARKYLLKHGTKITTAKIKAVHTQRDVLELQEVRNQTGVLQMNEIGRVSLQLRDALVVDRYSDVAATGAFILIDEASHQTAAAGMVV